MARYQLPRPSVYNTHVPTYICKTYIHTCTHVYLNRKEKRKMVNPSAIHNLWDQVESSSTRYISLSRPVSAFVFLSFIFNPFVVMCVYILIEGIRCVHLFIHYITHVYSSDPPAHWVFKAFIDQSIIHSSLCLCLSPYLILTPLRSTRSLLSFYFILIIISSVFSLSIHLRQPWSFNR